MADFDILLISVIPTFYGGTLPQAMSIPAGIWTRVQDSGLLFPSWPLYYRLYGVSKNYTPYKRFMVLSGLLIDGTGRPVLLHVVLPTYT